jgi:hypothetical protein
MVEQIQLIMKDQILKIAGVKSEKEFYKLFPNTPEGEEAFMKKYGKEFKKAQMGAAVKKAQVGTQTPSFNINQFGIGAQTMGQMNQASGASTSGASTPIVDTSNANWMFKDTSGAPYEASNINKGFTGSQGEISPGAGPDLLSTLPLIGGLAGAIGSFGAQRKAKKEARAWNKITGLQARAAETVDVDANRPKNYVRPEDNPVQPNQLFPTYGVGTNVLKRNGGPIRAQDGTELDTNSDLINKYPNSARQKQAIAERKSTSQVYGPQEAPADYQPIKEKPATNSRSKSKEVWQIWEEKTGTPWSEARKKGYTDGTAKSNLALADKLLKGKPLTTPSGNKPATKPSTKPAATKPQSYAQAMANKPKMGNRNVGNIQEPEEGNFITRAGEVLANPLQSFAHYSKYGELPVEGFSKYSKNAYDQVIGMVNPLYWANALGNAADYAGEGEYKKAALESLDAAGALGKIKYVKNIPYLQGLPAARKYGPAAKQIGEGAKRIGKGTTKQLGPGKMKQIGRGTHPNFVMYEDGGEIQNTYAPDTLYDDLGYEPLEDSERVKQYYGGGGIPKMTAGGFMNFMGQQGGAQALGMLAGAMGPSNAGQQAGAAIGGFSDFLLPGSSAIVSPVLGAIGGFIDKKFGDAGKIEREQKGIQRNQDRVINAQFTRGLHGQHASHMEEGGQLTNPQLITRFGELDQQDFYDYAHEGMDSLRAGGHLREYTPVTERGMEQYAMGGEVKTTWGGHAETISRNPYMPGTGETIMFRGKSHDESDGNGRTGIGVKYGKGKHDSYTDYAEYGSQNADADVEVERGEPAAELQDANGEKNLTVYGNLKIPNQYVNMLGDPKAKGKKFKNYIAEISKDEDRQTKLIDKSTSLLNDLDVNSPFDKLKFDSLTASINGANMKLKSIADKKKNAAYLQNAINDTAEENGLVADDLAKGKVKFNKEATEEYARHGKSIEKAQNGKYKVQGKGDKWAYTPAGETGVPEFDDPGLYVTQWSKSIEEALADKERADQMIKYLERAPGPEGAKVRAALAKRAGRDEKIKFIREQATNSQVGPMHYVVRAARDVTMPKKKEPVTTTQETTEAPTEKTYETTPYKRSKWMDIANMALPFLRPTDQEPLDPRQLSGEMYALSTNQVEPVQAQGFQPDLASPYDISYQDQMNEITAQTRAAQKMAQGNPAAQALIAGQAYDAINKVKGEEFRANQAMQAGVYNQNRATLNDAKLKNLDIYDRQYTRQEQAKSNTKAITQAALNSISDKYAKNKLENRELGIYENLYNYRYDPSGRAINMNPLNQFNFPTLYGEEKNPNMVPVKDADGNIIEFRSVTPTQKTTVKNKATTQAPAYTPINTTQQTPEQENLIPELLRGKNGSKTKKKIAMNGSIVKMYKTV